MFEVKESERLSCSGFNLNFSLSFCMCIFRTSPPQMTSDLGTALRPWSLSRCVAPTNIRTDWSYAVNPGTHPQPTHLTHPKETSRLKCEENTHLKQTETTKPSYVLTLSVIFSKTCSKGFCTCLQVWGQNRDEECSILYFHTETLNERVGPGEYGKTFLTNCFLSWFYSRKDSLSPVWWFGNLKK